jgi:hypothetical protein
VSALRAIGAQVEFQIECQTARQGIQIPVAVAVMRRIMRRPLDRFAEPVIGRAKDTPRRPAASETLGLLSHHARVKRAQGMPGT